MNNLPSLKEFGKKLDLLKQLFADGKEEQASGIAQTVFENYVFARDEFLRQEAELLSVQDQFTQIQDHSDKLELKFKETLQSYNSDFQFFSKLCNALDHVNTLKDYLRIYQKFLMYIYKRYLGYINFRLCSTATFVPD